MASVAIVNIGTLVTGELERPIDRADALLIRDGRIAQVGAQREQDLSAVEVLIDVDGATVVPGLIDSHVHVVFGDWTPRQNMIGFIESYLHGGITTMISASEVHLPGRPRSPEGVKALAFLAHECFAALRPGGVKVHAGRVILEPGLVEADFAELARRGVWMAKGGFGSFARQAEAAPMVRWAQKHGMIVKVHTGGASIPGSGVVTADDILALAPDIAAHANGGTTAPSDRDLARLVEEATCLLEVVQCGNTKAMRTLVDLARRAGCLHRIIVGSDSPTGSGVQPLAVLRTISHLASLCDVPPAEAVAMATGNTARGYRLPIGRLVPGQEADLVILDAPEGSAAQDALEAVALGDLPGIAGVLIDGELRIQRSRNTPPARRVLKVSRDGR